MSSLRLLHLVPIGLIACAAPHRTVTPAGSRAATPASATAPAPGYRVAMAGVALPPAGRGAPRCEEEIPVYAAGRRSGQVCLRDAAGSGLTVVDLSDRRTPRLFSEDPALGAAGRQPYRDTFLRLAAERFGSGPEWDLARADRYLELYGIFPTFAVLRQRLLDEDRHRCHDQVDNRALQALDNAAGGVRRRGPAFRAVQAHLRCERLLDVRRAGASLDERAADALRAYERKQMIVSFGSLGPETRRALLTDSRELDLRAALRALRERVADATGIIEDGTALGQEGLVVGRALGPALLYAAPHGGPLPDAAPDLLSRATDAAAQALGWTGPEEARAFFAALPEGATDRVALRLPPPPSYHGENMELRAELDRGDVWYDYPYTERGRELPQPVTRRPVLVLYARDGDREVPLVRWPTTIGGWQVERLPGGRLRYVYKGSDVGPRVWRDVVAAPAWLPPPGIPERELVRRRGRGWAVRDEVAGPGYRSAYGLVMLVHHTEGQAAEEEPVYEDTAIRTHGSANYRSIFRGSSHGCHRLLNHLAVRLASFLLSHRPFIRHGPLHTRYHRNLRWRGHSLELRVDSRGYRYELAPPVPVEVLPGQVRGVAKAPIVRPMPVPRDKLQEYRRSAAPPAL